MAYVVDCSIIGNHSEEIRQLTQRMHKVTTLLTGMRATGQCLALPQSMYILGG